jgi:hypothetical protein
MWLKRMSVTNYPEYRALRARIKLRNEYMREPSMVEVLEYLEGNPNAGLHPNAGLSYKDISAVFRAGEEVRQIYVLPWDCVAKVVTFLRKWNTRAYSVWDMTPI